MSRLTASQVIELGEYLEPDFEPSTLTIPYLLSILTFHGIKYPSQHNKAKLVQLFNDEIKPRANKFKKERERVATKSPSSQGIRDGITGQLVDEPAVRRSRRISRTPIEPDPPKPEPLKRRRSSAGPSLQRTTSKTKGPAQPTLAEESEPEEEGEEEPAPKVGRKKKDTAAAGTRARRVSQKFGSGADDSGWEDNNVFQSGAESSSPVRPATRSTTARRGRKPRTSLSAPPDYLPASKSVPTVPQTQKFEPRLPTAVSLRIPRGGLKEIDPARTRLSDVFLRGSSATEEGIEVKEEEDDNAPLEEEPEIEEEPTPDSVDDEVAKKIIALGADERAVSRKLPKPIPTSGSSGFTRFFVGLCAVLALSVLGNYKMESSSIGYCYPGTDTNSVLMERESARIAQQECSRRLIHGDKSAENEGTESDHCTPLALIPLPHPTKCTPCPPHAHCIGTTLTCDNTFVVSPHPMASIPFFREITSGLPGFGSVAFPPTCVPDERRIRNIKGLKKSLEAHLAHKRGDRVCQGTVLQKDQDGGEAKAFGVALRELKDSLRKIKEKHHTEGNFEEMFDEGVAELVKSGLLVMDTDSNGETWVAANRVDMDLKCKVRVAARDAWEEWRAHFFGLLLAIIGGFWTKSTLKSRRLEAQRVSELVSIALDTLRTQELSYHADPITYPQPYLSSLHLRDLVLQDEHSIPVRKRLWDKVEHIVEGNANVRANLEEVQGGDERVWRWVGGAGREAPRTPRTPRVTFSGQDDSGRPVA